MKIIVTDGPVHVGNWASEESECDHCGYRWVAVHPCSEYLQCSICKKISPSTVNLIGKKV